MDIPLPEQEKIKIANTQDVFEIMRDVLKREHRLGQMQEHFWVLGLNNSHHLMYIELVSLGSINRAMVHPLDVFSLASSKKSAKIIFVHNHTGDNLQPSQEDISLTAKLKKGADLLQIKILDHIVINTEDYHSFKEGGEMQKVIDLAGPLDLDVPEF